MTIRLLYHDPDCPGAVSPFDEGILGIVRGDEVSIACPYLGLEYLRRITRLTKSWRLLTDLEAWLRSLDHRQRERVYAFLIENRYLIRHYPLLHAKVVIGSHSAMVGSANFTSAGMRQRTEVSVRFENEPQVQELTEWFDVHWRRAKELDEVLLKRIAVFMRFLPKKRVIEDLTKPFISRPLTKQLARLVQLPGGPVIQNGTSRHSDVYFNFGHEEGWREWDDARRFKFISAGGGRWYSAPLATLVPGDRVWVYARPYGYVGVARVTGFAEPASRFQVEIQGGEVRPIMEVVKSPDGYHNKDIKNLKRCEYFVPVRWLDSKPVEGGVKGSDLFTNRRIICRPTSPIWRSTLRRLKKEFPIHSH